MMTRVMHISSFTVSGRPFGMLKQYFVRRDDVFIRDFPYLFGRDTSYDRILRNVVKDHGSGTYHGMITYRHAPTDGSMRTYPHAVADRYWLRCFQAQIPLLSHYRVTGTSEDYSGRNEAHVANRYWTRVKEGNFKVHIGHAKEMGVESKVKVNAMLDHDLFVIRTEYLLEQFLSAFCIRRTGLIIFQNQFVSLVLPVMRNIHRMAYESFLARYKLHYFFRCHKVYLLLAHHVEKVSMESTSVYRIPIWRILAPHFHLQLVNPYFIKQLHGHKSDVADAQWIAECPMKNFISSSFVPPEDIQQFRQYDRRIFVLDEEIVRKLSKLDAVMQRCNIRLSNYVSNVDCKSYKDVVRKISEGVTDPEILIEEIHGRIIKHHGRETILASLTGVVSQAEVDVLRQLREELDLAEEHKQECLERMLDICKEKYPDELRRLQTIPGVKERTATSLIAEIGTDMSKFETANHLAAWSGLRPRNDESNRKFKSRRITHGNVYLRKNIIQCAWAASRTKNCFFSRFSYHQTQVRKKNKMKVIVSVARKLLVAAWHVIHDKTDYVDFQKQDRQSPASNG